MSELDSSIQLFCNGMDAAIKDKHLPDAGHRAGKLGPNTTDSAAYIKALRARLINLGYLGQGKNSDNRTSTTVDTAFVKAVKHFQRDVGLVDQSQNGDGWAGPKTWRRLECLVSFENDQNPDQWNLGLDLLTNPAVLRAVYLRLYTMGFFASWSVRLHTKTNCNPGENPLFAKAIAHFSSFVKALGLYEQNNTEELNPILLQLIFNHDELIKVIADKSRSDPVFYEGFFDQYQQPLSAIARIELWLLGYDVSPGEEEFKKTGTRNVGPKKSANNKVSSMEKAIRAYWRDNPEERQNAPKTAVSASLFVSFQTLHEETDTNESHLNDQLNHKVKEVLESNKAAQLKKAFKQLASSIWDGIKRATKLLFRMIKKVVSKTVDFIANLARYISRKARGPFIYVTKAVHIMHAGLAYSFGSLFKGSESGIMAMSKDKDFDQRILIDAAASRQQLNQVLKEHKKANKAYVAGTRILALLINIFKKTSLLLSNAAGWLVALLSLSSLYNSIKEIKNEIENYEMDVSNPESIFKAQIS